MDETIKREIEECFIERMGNTICEKISYCIEVRKMKPDKATHLVTQVVINLPKYLLPLKVTPQEDMVSNYKLTIANDELVKHSSLI